MNGSTVAHGADCGTIARTKDWNGDGFENDVIESGETTVVNRTGFGSYGEIDAIALVPWTD